MATPKSPCCIQVAGHIPTRRSTGYPRMPYSSPAVHDGVGLVTVDIPHNKVVVPPTHMQQAIYPSSPPPPPPRWKVSGMI